MRAARSTPFQAFKSRALGAGATKALVQAGSPPGVNNLTIDSRFFPTGDFNFHEPSHRDFLAWSFLVYFSLYLPLKKPALDGLEFRVVSTSLTKATRQLKSAQGVSGSITGTSSDPHLTHLY